jgi:hypothetical protein
VTLELESGELYAENMSVAELLAVESAYEARGFNLAQKGYLLGVPFVITGLRFAAIPPVPDKGPNKGVKARGYVTAECAVYPEADVKRALQAKRISHYDREARTTTIPTAMEDLRVLPEERFVFNDGSTGFRRQIVFLLHRYGYISVVDSTDRMDERDPAFDLPWDEWHSIGSQITTVGDVDLPYISRDNIKPAPFILKAPRGLRVSEYTADGIGDAETFYLG